MAKEHKWRRSMKRWTLGQLRGMIHVDIVACISMWQICYLCRILCALKCIIMQQFIFDSFAHSFASFCLFRFALCFYFHLGCGIKSRFGKWEYRIETLFRQYLFNPDEQRYGRIKAKKKNSEYAQFRWWWERIPDIDTVQVVLQFILNHNRV